MNRTGTLSRFVLALAACLALVPPPGIAADQCERSWDRASDRMRQVCNVGMESNAMCLVQRPVEVSAIGGIPFPFQNEGHNGRIPEGLRALIGREGGGGRGFTFLKVLTQGLNSAGVPTPLTQEVVLIAFGETSMTGIQNLGPPEPPPAACRGEMFIDTPADGGLVTSTVAGGAGDQISVLVPQEQVGIIGRTPTGERLLVRVSEGATGWALAQNIVLFVDAACPSVATLPHYDQAMFDDVFETRQRLATASAFRLESRPVDDADALECSLDGFPPSGLLVFNPSGAEVVLTVNGVDLLMSSSALVAQYPEVFSVVVLEGVVTVRTALGARSARAGEVVNIASRQPHLGAPTLGHSGMAGGAEGPWCDRIYRLAQAAFSRRGRLGVPVERINFCRFMPPRGYPLHPAAIEVAPVPQVEVPELRRRSYAEARRILGGLGLGIGRVSGDQAPDSLVVAQEPQPGGRARPGDRVDLALERPQPAQVQVPDLRRRSLAEARAILADTGLDIGRVSGEQTRGSYVASQSPEPGSRARVGDRVDLVLSRPQSAQVAVPDVVGELLPSAVKRLEAAGLRYRRLDSGQGGDAFYVVRQSPAPGTPVPTGTTIGLTVQGVIE